MMRDLEESDKMAVLIAGVTGRHCLAGARAHSDTRAPAYVKIQSAYCCFSLSFLFFAVAITCFTRARRDFAFALAVPLRELIVV